MAEMAVSESETVTDEIQTRLEANTKQAVPDQNGFFLSTNTLGCPQRLPRIVSAPLDSSEISNLRIVSLGMSPSSSRSCVMAIGRPQIAISRRQLAKDLAVHPETVRRWEQLGLPVLRITPRTVRYLREDVEEFFRTRC